MSGRGGLDRLAEALVGRSDDDLGCRRACLCRGTRGWCCSAISCRRSTEIQAAVGQLAAIPVGGYLLQVLDPAEADAAL